MAPQARKPIRKPPKQDVPSRPHVILDCEFEEGQIFLVLANIGPGCAHDIVTAFDKPLRGLEGSRDMASLGVFTRLAFMPPGKRIRVYLDSASAFFSRDEPRRIKVTIRYADDGGKRHVTRLTHDLGAFEDLGYIRRQN